MDLSISEACKRLGKEFRSRGKLWKTPPSETGKKVGLKWFGLKIFIYQQMLEWLNFIFTKYEHST